MHQVEATVGAEDDDGGMATCGRVVRQHDRISDDGEAVEVRLRHARRRGVRDESSGAANLSRGGQVEAALGDGRTRPYRHGGGEKLQN